jgi:hypothetical protein
MLCINQQGEIKDFKSIILCESSQQFGNASKQIIYQGQIN